MPPMRRFTFCSVLLVVATAGIALWLTSSMWYPAGTAEQRNLARLRQELSGYRTFQATAPKLNAFGDRLVVMLKSDRESAEIVIDEYIGVLGSATWLHDEDRAALKTEIARQCLRIYVSQDAWDGRESERVIRSLVDLLPRWPATQFNGSDGRQADLELLLDLWQRNRWVIDDAFDPDDMSNQGLVSVRPPMNDVRYLEPQHVIPDTIRAQQRRREYEQDVTENRRIHVRMSQQTNARQLDETLRHGIVEFVKYAFENPPDNIDVLQIQFQKHGFEIPDQQDFLSGLRAQYERVQESRREQPE